MYQYGPVAASQDLADVDTFVLDGDVFFEDTRPQLGICIREQCPKTDYGPAINGEDGTEKEIWELGMYNTRPYVTIFLFL